MFDRNEDYRFGSAAWAGEAEVRAAGLFAPKGPQIGYVGERPIHLDGDAPVLVTAGAGAGKTRDFLAYIVCRSPGQRAVVLDPRGELGAISIHVHAGYGDFAWFWNPRRLCGLPHHRCNPLDILDPGSPHFHSDARFIAEGFIPLSEGSGRYFGLRARDWLENIMKARVEAAGGTSLPDVYRTLTVVESDAEAWASQLEAMLGSRFEGVRRTAGEMLAKQQDAPREFGAIMGELYAHLGFLDDPALRAALDNAEVSLAALCDDRQPAKLFLNIPAEGLSIWSPLVRLIFTVTMLYKSRLPERPRITLIVDEAGQLGRFEALLRAFTFGRGAGVRAFAIFQDIGQIIRHYGAPALQSFMGSAQLRTFFGVRDYDTARLVSDMLGSETLHYDDTLQQDGARRVKWDTLARVAGGGDPFAAARDYAHSRRAALHRAKQARPLMTPDEVLALPEDKAIHFISGKNLRPLLADKYPYFTRREMAGLYLANPYHPPVDSVPVATRLGMRRVPIVSGPVPRHLAGFPQHRGGVWSTVQGYPPG